MPVMLILAGVLAYGVLRQFQGSGFVFIQNGEQGFGQAAEVPLGDSGLVAVSVSALPVYRAKHGGRVIPIHKGTGAVVDGFSGNAHVVGVHHPMHKTYLHPAGNECSLPVDHCFEECQIRVGFRVYLITHLRVVPVDGVIGQGFEFCCALCGGKFKSANTDMAGGHPGENGTGLSGIPEDRFSGGHHGQAAGGGYA